MTQTTQTAKYNRMLFYILLAHLPVVMFIVPIGYGTQGFTVPAGLLLGVAIVASFVLLRTSVAYSIFAGVLLMALSATMIQAQLGRIEMHFHIFGALALLLIFRDWRPIVVAAATIAIHHLALTWAQLEGVSFAGQPLMVFSYGCSWGIAMLHATFVVFESSALVYYAVAMQREERVAQQLTDAVLQAHEQNDLGVRIEDHNSSVATSFNLLMESFSQLTQQLSASSDTLRQEAEQMNGSVAEAQQEIRSQHVQTEHMASAIAQMTSSIHSVAESTQQAADSAQTSNQKAEEGVELFNEAQAAMRMLQDSMQAASGMIGHLEEDAENIGQVVDVISMISQQTNLLALNAAIEAARAGDHGRGFAVVAEEVRSLAQRTKASTDEIQRIISKLQSDTKEAVVSISQGESKTQETSARLSVAGTNLSDILSASSDILQLNLQIAEASSEQSQTASVINQNVATISASSDNIVRHSADNLKIAEHVAGVSRTIGERVAAYQH